MDGSTRLLFHKINKTLDLKDIQIASYQHQAQALKAKVKGLQPAKPKKSIPDPNGKFVRIEDVMRAKEQLKTTLQRKETSSYVSEKGVNDLTIVFNYITGDVVENPDPLPTG